MATNTVYVVKGNPESCTDQLNNTGGASNFDTAVSTVHSKNLLWEKDKKDTAEAFSFTPNRFFLVLFLVYILERWEWNFIYFLSYLYVNLVDCHEIWAITSSSIFPWKRKSKEERDKNLGKFILKKNLNLECLNNGKNDCAWRLATFRVSFIY